MHSFLQTGTPPSLTQAWFLGEIKLGRKLHTCSKDLKKFRISTTHPQQHFPFSLAPHLETKPPRRQWLRTNSRQTRCQKCLYPRPIQQEPGPGF